MALPPVYTDRKTTALQTKLLAWQRLNPSRAINRDLLVLLAAQEPLAYSYFSRDFAAHRDGALCMADVAVTYKQDLYGFGPLADSGVAVGYSRYDSTADAGPYALPNWLPAPGSPYTIFVFTEFHRSGGSRGIFSWGDYSLGEYVWLSTQANQKIRLTERDGATLRISDFMLLASQQYPEDGEPTAFVVRSTGDFVDCICEHIHQVPNPAPTVLTPAASPTFDTYTRNALVTSVVSNAGTGRPYIVGLWRRWLPDAEAFELIDDPFLPIRPDAPDFLELARRPLPCPSFPVIQAAELPHDQGAGDAGTAVISAPAKRRRRDVIELELADLDESERQQLVTAWDAGRGLAVPFPYVIPGTTEPELVIFDEPHRHLLRSPASSVATVRLRVVNPADWDPTPSIVDFGIVKGTGSSTLILASPITVRDGDVLVYVGLYDHGTAGYVSTFRWDVDNVHQPPDVEYPATPPGVPTHLAAGVYWTPQPGTATARLYGNGASPDNAMLAAFVVRGITGGAAEASAAGQVNDDQAPALAITTLTDGALVIAGFSLEALSAGYDLSAPLPLSSWGRESLEATPELELVVASRTVKRAGATSIPMAVSSAGTFAVKQVALALTPAVRGP